MSSTEAFNQAMYIVVVILASCSIVATIGLVWGRTIRAWYMRRLLKEFLRVSKCPCGDIKTATVCMWLSEPGKPPCAEVEFWIGKEIPDSWGMGCEDGRA